MLFTTKLSHNPSVLFCTSEIRLRTCQGSMGRAELCRNLCLQGTPASFWKILSCLCFGLGDRLSHCPEVEGNAEAAAGSWLPGGLREGLLVELIILSGSQIPTAPADSGQGKASGTCWPTAHWLSQLCPLCCPHSDCSVTPLALLT